jgi:hypothetical protein
MMDMNRALGFRAEAKQFYWAVVEGTRSAPKLVGHGKAAAPVDLDVAAALSWYGGRVRLVIETHKPSVAAVRSPEPTALGSNKETFRHRLRMEGVLLEVTHSSGVKVTIGSLAMISGRLGSQAKKYVEQGQLRELDLTEMAAPLREAVLVAVAVLP